MYVRLSVQRRKKQTKIPFGIAFSQYMYFIGRLLFNLIWWNIALLLSISLVNASSVIKATRN